jgi:hypothetical protein
MLRVGMKRVTRTPSICAPSAAPTRRAPLAPSAHTWLQKRSTKPRTVRGVKHGETQRIASFTTRNKRRSNKGDRTNMIT